MSRSSSPLDIKEEPMDIKEEPIGGPIRDANESTDMEEPKTFLDLKMELDSEIEKEQESIKSMLMHDIQPKSSECEKEKNINEEPMVIASTSSNHVMETKKVCCVLQCRNNSIDCPCLDFFFLPTENPRRKEWLFLICGHDLRKKTNPQYVCASHFHAKYKMVALNETFLHKDAIPEFNLPNSKKNIATQTNKSTIHACTQTSVNESRHVQTVKKRSGKFTNTKDLERQVSTLNGQLHEWKNKLWDEHTVATRKAEFDKLCNRFLSKQLADLIQAETILKDYSRENRDRTYYTNFCLNLYHASPQAYHLLEKAFALPSKNTLGKASVPVTTEVTDDLIEKFKTKVDSMTELEINCTVVVDSMKVTSSLFYNITQDKLIGVHEVDGVKSPLLVTRAMVVAVQGLFVRWVQPIGYALLSNGKDYDEDASKWLHKILDKLINMGLKIRSFISNDESVFSDMVKKHDLSIEKPYFVFNQTNIYYMFDPSPLIIELRDNFTKYDFCYFDGDDVAKYEHIRLFHSKDSQKRMKLAENLEIGYVHPTQQESIKLNIATELFSKHVAAAISIYIDYNVIESSATNTVNFLLLMEELYDTLNSTISLDTKTELFLEKMIKFFHTLKLIDPHNGNEASVNVKFIRGFHITIFSLLSLLKDLKLEKYNRLSTSFLNRGQINILFDKTKKKNGQKPTSQKLVSAFRIMCFENLAKTNKSSAPTEDLSEFISKMNEFNPSTGTHNNDDRPVSEFKEVAPSHYRIFEIPPKTENAFFDWTVFLFKQCIIEHENCEILQPKLEASSSLDDFPKFITFIEILENKFREAFTTYINTYLNSKIANFIHEQIKSLPFNPPCPCFPVAYLRKLFVRGRIFLALKYNNKKIKRIKRKTMDALCVNRIF